MLKYLTIDITPLRVSRDYRLLFFGQLISFFGSMMTFIVVPYQMYKITQSNENVGYLYLAEFVPMFLLAFVGGALADTLDKRKMLRVTEILQTLVTVIILINSLLPTPRIWVLYVAVALHAGFTSLQRPAFEALIQKVMPAEQMPAVAALNSMRWAIGAIISPAIAGFIAAQFSASIAYSIDLITFVASLGAVFLISAVPVAENTERASVKSILEGVRYALKRKELLGTYLFDIIAMFFAMPISLFPALASTYGEFSLGLFPAAMGVGMMIANLTSGWAKTVQRHGLMVILAAGLWGVGIIFFGLSTQLWLALFFLAFAGFFDMLSGIFRMTIWNQTIPNRLRGRLAGIEMISYLTGPMLGNAKMGIVAERFSVKTAIVSGGILCVVGTVILAALLPQFINYTGSEGIKQREIEEAEREEMLKLTQGEF